VRYSVVAVGKAKAPYLDDLQHYGKLLSRYARVDVVEVADDEALQRRIPELPAEVSRRCPGPSDVRRCP